MDGSIRNDRVVVLRVDASETDRLPHQHCDAFGLHFLHDFSAIAFDCPGADVELRSDGLAGVTGSDEVENLDLARRQARKLGRQRLYRFLLSLLLEQARQPAIDRRDELHIVDRLLDEVLRTRLDRGHRHRDIGVAGDEDHREPNLAARELAGELDAVHAGHPDIGHDAAGTRSIERAQEGIGGFIGLDRETEDVEHLAERIADRFLVVDNKDRRNGRRHRACDWLRGSENRNSVAPACPEWSHTRPPWESTIAAQIESPRPSPSNFEVVSGANKRSASSFRMPGPLSEILISTRAGASNHVAAILIRPSG